MHLLSSNLIKMDVYSFLTDSLEKLRNLLANALMHFLIFINVRGIKKPLKIYQLLYPCKSHCISYPFTLESSQKLYI